MKHEEMIRFRTGLAKRLEQPNKADLLEGAVNVLCGQWPQINFMTRIRKVEPGVVSAHVESPAGSWEILIDRRIPYKTGVTEESHFLAQYDPLNDMLYIRMQS